MKKLFVFIFFLSIVITAHSQEKSAESLKMTSAKPANPPESAQKYLTSKYAGLYDYGTDDTSGGTGIISIYPETDTTVLFYIDLVRGAPSYNLGTLYGRIILKNDTGLFAKKLYYNDPGCKWAIYFAKDSLKIRTVGGYECGFGNAVYADGVYKRESNESPEYFEDSEGKVYFSKTKPEDYYNEAYNYSPEVSLRINNVSKYFIKELKLKIENSIIYFRNIPPYQLSDAEGLSYIGNSGLITVQLLRKRFFKTRLTIIHYRISLYSPGTQNERAAQKGSYILNIDVPKSEKPYLKTTLERQQ